MTQQLSIQDFKSLYKSNNEFAVIDPREELFFTRAHLFAATNMPLSRLELLAVKGIPDLSTQIILCDDGEDHSEKASNVLTKLGYTHISILAGGLPAWALMGGAVFSGMNVPSKAFGEVIERDLNTPTISAIELHRKIANGDELLLLDARPEKEHEEYCIPGSICCPSVEMILRCASLISKTDTDVIVHCAGRTRSIIGAQTLIDSGLFKSVHSLCNGTPAWEFEGWETEKGNTNLLPRPIDNDNVAARNIAAKIRDRWSIPEIPAGELAGWKNRPGTHYLFDIRDEDEYLAGHIPGTRHIAGGQLLQTTENHIVVQNAHIALIDNDGVRAVTAAMWLRRMGWSNVTTCKIDESSDILEPALSRIQHLPHTGSISIDEAAIALNTGSAIVCDIRKCYEYRREHIEGAGYLNRSDIERDIKSIPSDVDIILISTDHDYAGLIAKDLRKYGRNVQLLDGNIKSWKNLGHPVSSGQDWLISRPVDTYFESDHYDNQQISLREHRAYLNWEIALIDHIEGDPAVRFDVR